MPDKRSEKDMFFSELTMAIMDFARDEAFSLYHARVGEMHFLIGLIELNRGRAIAIMQSLGIDLNELKERIESKLLPSSESEKTGILPLAKPLVRAMEKAVEIALDTDSEDIEPEHVILGLLDQGDNLVSGLLAEYEIDYDKFNKAVEKYRDQ
jgi:ATP-dependent Clp protease ATP-binding subunit ClpC